MIFDFFKTCEKFVAEPVGQNNPIDTAIQQTQAQSTIETQPVVEPNKPIQPKMDENGNFIPLEQEDANVNFDLSSELNQLQDDKDFGNPVPQDAWESDKIGEWFEEGGNIDALKAFDIDDLDVYERFMYDDILRRNPTMPQEEILVILINNVEGDTTQLSDKLSEVAEKYNKKYAKGGKVKQTGSTTKKQDKLVKAKRIGYRYSDELAKKLGLSANAKPTAAHIAKYLGNGIYFENRKNRSDVSRMKKFEDGGDV